MKIRMKTILSGPDGTAHPGQIIDVLPDAGAALVAGGYADNVAEQLAVVATPETAAIVAPEVAVQRRAKKAQ